MTQFISFFVVGLGWPASQKSHSSSPLIGNAPQLKETDCTPGVEATAESAARNDWRIAAGVVCKVEGESEKPKVRTLRGLKPGATFHSCTSVRSARPAPIKSTRASASSTTTKTP